MCMNNFHAEKLIFDKFTTLFNLVNFLPFLMINNDHSAYSEINLKLYYILLISYRCDWHAEDVHEEL